MSTAEDSQRGLPAEARYPGDPAQIGFAWIPDDRRLESAHRVLENLTKSANGLGAPDGKLLPVTLTLARLGPGLPVNLFGFHLVNVGENGTVSLEVDEQHEVLYAFVVNQPVGVIRESAARALLNLVSRQGEVQQVMENKQGVDDLPTRVAASDARNADLAWDTPPEVSATLSVLSERAVEQNLRLQVEFRPDPFPDAASLNRRLSALRHLYNTEDRVRDAVDRTVSTMGARSPSFRGGPEHTRLFLSRQGTLQGMRQFTNQTVRDALVCGNGYLQLGARGLDSWMRCLRPEAARVKPDGSMQELQGDNTVAFKDGEVVHLRGIEQVTSPYGISILEPLLDIPARRQIAAETLAAQSALPAGASEATRIRSEALVKVAKQMEGETDARLEQLLGFFPVALDTASGDLYFPGQEKLK
jgi:hypothetical protein